MINDINVGHDWRAEPPVYARREGAKRRVKLAVSVEVYDEGEGWDAANAAADRVRQALAEAAGTWAVYDAEVEVSDWDE